MLRACAAKLKHLDFFLILDSLQCDIEACKFLSPLHQFKKVKLNNSLTDDPVFVNSLKEEIKNVTSCFDKEQDASLWEYLKNKIFRFSEDYANKKAEQRKEKQLYLENKVINLEKELANSSNMSDVLLTEYEITQAELENLYDHIADGAILRTKAGWHEEGDKNTK